MRKYGLDPDQLIASYLRRLHSSRPGYQPLRKRDWIRAIEKIHQSGRSISARFQNTNPHLYSLGVWLFGWDNALRAAGFQPDRVRLHRAWTPEKVLTAIKTLRRRKQRLAGHRVREHDSGLFEAARRYFGQWKTALRAAGVPTSRYMRN